MTKVWAVKRDSGPEDYDVVVSIWSTPEKASEEAGRLEEMYPDRFTLYSVEEYTVDPR